jgi:hypothetical protein
VDAPLEFPPELAAACVRWIREALSGARPAPFPAIRPERSNWTLVTVLRGNGHEGAVSLAEADTLDRALIEAATDLEAGWRRNREVLGFPRVEQAMAGLRLEIHRVRENADVVPRDEETLQDLWEMGVDGAILRDRIGDKRQAGTWPGSVAVTRGITQADQFLRGIAREVRWDSVRPWRDAEVEVGLFPDPMSVLVLGYFRCPEDPSDADTPQVFPFASSFGVGEDGRASSSQTWLSPAIPGPTPGARTAAPAMERSTGGPGVAHVRLALGLGADEHVHPAQLAGDGWRTAHHLVLNGVFVGFDPTAPRRVPGAWDLLVVVLDDAGGFAERRLYRADGPEWRSLSERGRRAGPGPDR